MRAGQSEFGFKQIPLRDQDIQVVGQSAFIPKIRQPQGRPQGINLLCLCIPLVTRRVHRHQRIFHFAKRDQHPLASADF